MKLTQISKLMIALTLSSSFFVFAEEKVVETKAAETTETNKEATNKIDPSITLVEGPSAHLTFHMGLSAEGQNFIGGSIANHGKVSVHGGYIVVLPIDEKCNPLEPITQTFSKVPSGEIIPFRVPINASLSGYRLIGFNAYDDMGFPLPAVDDTLEIISERIPGERKACEEKRTAS
ncbi:hypothetical protein [Thorsellia anophelis]|uniref:Uncharacterized protein n=1 Tax=Thorsellia anophelis DSM 18579 TaxID=1123402 RepID=A0A1H9ZXU7_9GAMM|nr:hypothetical protein [Thorsellia anophelis]SES86586.1 hypothetical protein SAMN02583745_00755 [Thorsellia anophelis DSM 18579]